MARSPKQKNTPRSLYVRQEDTDVMAWLSHQRNVSESMRRLIKDTIERVGTGDYIDTIAHRLNTIETGKSESEIKKEAMNTAREAPDNNTVLRPKPETNQVDLLGLDH